MAAEIRAGRGYSIPGSIERDGLGWFTLGRTRIGSRRPIGSVAPADSDQELEATSAGPAEGEIEATDLAIP